MSRPEVSKPDRMVAALVYAQHRPVVGRFASALLQLLGVYIPRMVPVGVELRLPHSTAGVVVHAKTRIGDRVTIFHNVTIGRADAYDVQPGEFPGAVIEDDAVLCAGAVVLPGVDAELVIGRGAVVGANAVVTRSVPAGEVWAGNPAACIKARVST